MKLCWLYQRIILSRLDEGSGLPRRVQRHLQSCPRCRGVCEPAMAVGRALSADSPEKNPPPSPFLHGKIMLAIQAERERPWQPLSGFPRWLLPGAVAAACVIFTGIVWLRPPAAPVAIVPAPGLTPVELALNVDLPNAAQMNKWSAALDKPLEVETQLVLNDAKTAIDSLKNSFLPNLDKGPRNGGN